MTRDEFLTEMQDVLQTEETLSFETVLEELDIKTLEDIAVKAGL